MIPGKPGRLVLATLILSQLGACVTKASCNRMLEHQWVLGALRADGLPNSLGMSTLHYATYWQKRAGFFWLLENGVDPNLKEMDGGTPLMIAALRPQDELSSIRALLEAGGDVNAVDAAGKNALVYAIYSRYRQNASLLAEAGADLGATRKALAADLASARTDKARAGLEEAIDYFDEHFGARPAD